jgi:ankyrin repeat protein
MIEWLATSHAEINARDSAGRTPLALASVNLLLDAMAVLRKRGATM